jgi:hypothetical protein
MWDGPGGRLAARASGGGRGAHIVRVKWALRGYKALRWLSALSS